MTDQGTVREFSVINPKGRRLETHAQEESSKKALQRAERTHRAVKVSSPEQLEHGWMGTGYILWTTCNLYRLGSLTKGILEICFYVIVNNYSNNVIIRIRTP